MHESILNLLLEMKTSKLLNVCVYLYIFIFRKTQQLIVILTTPSFG